MPDEEPRRPYASCPSCGSTTFTVYGLVGYAQPYDGLRDDFGLSEIQWEADFVQEVKCASCERDCTRLLVNRGVIHGVYDPVERELGAGPEAR
jgi:hypothetical protein